MARVHEVQGLCVDVRYLVLGALENNVYIVSDDAATLVVDPSCEAALIMEALDGAPLSAIVITHGHYDHVGAAAELRAMTGAPVIASAVDAPVIEHPRDMGTSQRCVPCTVDRTVSHGDVVEAGAMRWKVIETPGHTKGSICLFDIPPFGNHDDGCPVLISGDTLFAGTVGRTDFEGGSMRDMRASIKKLAALPDETVVLPGHNDLTTIAWERRRVFARFGDEE